MKAETPASPTDTRIVCPLCGYDQTGATSAQCPECGVARREAERRAHRRYAMRLFSDTAVTLLLLPLVAGGVAAFADDYSHPSVVRRVIWIGGACLALNSARFAFTFLPSHVALLTRMGVGLLLTPFVFLSAAAQAIVLPLLLGWTSFDV